MKLVAKITILVAAIVVTLCASSTLINLRNNVDSYEENAASELQGLAHAISRATGRIWELSGSSEATDFLRSESGASLSAGLRILDAAEEFVESGIQTRYDAEDIRMTMVAPVVVHGETRAVVELVRTVPGLPRFTRDQLGGQLSLAVVLMVLAAILLVRLRGETQRETLSRTTLLEGLRRQERFAAVGRLAARMAHDLGTPLSVIQGRARLIEEASSDPVVTADSRTITSQVARMAQVIQELLDYSRSRPPVVRRIAISSIVERAEALLSPLLEERRIRLENRGESGIYAWADERLIIQVLTNLFTNAMDALPAGGVVTVQTGRETVADPGDHHALAGEYAVIEVTDSGRGIPEAVLEQLFEPSFAIEEETGSTGPLGLSICHGIVRDHGGWMTAESRPGEGSTFSIFLPKSEQTS